MKYIFPKGFIHLRCPHCGSITETALRHEHDSLQCRHCGNQIEAMPLMRLYINCECGSRFKYRTNRTEQMFDITCLHCGYPVTVQYSGRFGIYAPVGQTHNRRKKSHAPRS